MGIESYSFKDLRADVLASDPVTREEMVIAELFDADFLGLLAQVDSDFFVYSLRAGIHNQELAALLQAYEESEDFASHKTEIQNLKNLLNPIYLQGLQAGLRVYVLN